MDDSVEIINKRIVNNKNNQIIEILMSETHPSCAVSISQSLGHVIGLMAATKHHRVFLVDHDRKTVGVVSISDIMKFAGAELNRIV